MAFHDTSLTFCSICSQSEQGFPFLAQLRAFSSLRSSHRGSAISCHDVNTWTSSVAPIAGRGLQFCRDILCGWTERFSIFQVNRSYNGRFMGQSSSSPCIRMGKVLTYSLVCIAGRMFFPGGNNSMGPREFVKCGDLTLTFVVIDLWCNLVKTSRVVRFFSWRGTEIIFSGLYCPMCVDQTIWVLWVCGKY